MTTQLITHEIDLATLLEGESIEVEFSVEITERDGVDEGSVEIKALHGAMTDADTARCKRMLGKAIREEIIRLMNSDELVDAARVKAADG